MSATVKDRDVEDFKRGGAVNLAGTLARALKPVYLAVIANLYGAEIFGQFVLCYATIDLLVGLAVFGSDHGLWNFISRYREEEKPALEALALRTGFLWSAGISIVFAVGIWFSADDISNHILNAPGLTEPLRIIAWTVPAYALARVLLAATRGLRIMRYHVLVFDLGEMILIFTLAPAFYFLGFQEHGVFWMLLLTALTILVTAGVCFLRHFSLRELLLNRAAGFISREVLSYDLALGWGLVAGLLTRRVDIFMIAHYQPTEVVGAYTLASEFAGALGKIRSSFSPIVVPLLASRKAHSNESLREPSAFMALSVTVLSLPIWHLFLVAGQPLLSLYQPEFVDAYGALLIITAAHLLHGLMGPPGEALSVAGLPRYIAIFASVQVALISVLGWLLIPKFAMVGAALASGGALLLSRVPLLIIAKRLLSYSSLSRALIVLFVKALATLGIGAVIVVLFRERWPWFGYSMGVASLLAFVALAWNTIASTLNKDRAASSVNSAKPKLLIFTSEYPPLRTGVATYNQVVAEGLMRHGYAVTVLTFRPPGVRTTQTQVREIRLPVGTNKWLEPLRIVLGLVAHRILAPRYDAVMLSSDLAQFIAGDIRLSYSKQTVCVVHGSEVTKRYPSRSLFDRIGWRLRLRTLQNAPAVIAISRYTSDLLASAGLDRSKIQVIHNGIPSVWFDTKPDAKAICKLKQDLGIRRKEIVLLTLARVVSRKGHKRVLRALKQVVALNGSVRYVIAGTGEHLEQVRRLTEELHLGDIVIFAGEVPERDKMIYYDMADVFVMPSLHDGRRVEGLGISFIEAAARHKPSIGGRHGGVPEVIKEEETGYLVDPDDVETLAERLSRLTNDAELRKRLGDAAYRYASERFRDTHMVSRIDSLLKTTISSAG